MSNQLTLKGKIYQISAPNQVTEKFKKQDFVIETSDTYPQKVLFQLINDRTALINPFKVGDDVEVSFNVTGKESGDRFFNSLNAWRIVKSS